MGKWTEIVKTLPKREEEETPWRLQVNRMKDEARAQGAGGVEPTKARYRTLLEQKEALEAQLSQTNAGILACQEILTDDRAATGRETPYYFEDGARIEVNDSVSFSVEDSERLMEWVKKEQLERLLTLAAPTRDSIARQRLEAGQALPDGLKAAAYASVRFVKARKK